MLSVVTFVNFTDVRFKVVAAMGPTLAAEDPQALAEALRAAQASASESAWAAFYPSQSASS